MKFSNKGHGRVLKHRDVCGDGLKISHLYGNLFIEATDNLGDCGVMLKRDEAIAMAVAIL